MIRSFRHKGLKRFFLTGSTAGINAKQSKKVALILRRLHTAAAVGDMDVPGFGLHPLKGDLHGFWAVSASGAWRIIFRFDDKGAHDVDYMNYH
jgi:proteic killer suppression protein